MARSLRNMAKEDRRNESEKIGCSTLKHVDHTFKELLLFPIEPIISWNVGHTSHNFARP